MGLIAALASMHSLTPRGDAAVEVLRLVGEVPATEGAQPLPADEGVRVDVAGDRGDSCCDAATTATASATTQAPDPAPADRFASRDHPAPPRTQPAEAGPEAETVPEPEAPRDAWEQFVHVEPQDDATSSPDSERIAAHDSVVDIEARTPVTTDRNGPLTPRIRGPEDRSASPTLARHDGTLEAAAGNRPADAPASRAVSGGGGGGGGGEASGAGSPDRGGDRLAGGQVARAGGGAGRPSAASSSAGLPDARQDPEAPRADDNTRGPDWWRAQVFRMVVSAPSAAAPHRDDDIASPTSGDGVAVVERPGVHSDRGGSTTLQAREQALPGVADRDEGPTEGPGLGTSDPVEALRLALGWGTLDRDRLAPRPQWAGTHGGLGADHTSPQTVADDVDIRWEPAVNARATPVGRYIAQVEDIVGARWQQQDIGTSSRAVGIQGQVTVQYTIRPTGRVTEIELARSSGHPILDQIALDAIPRKLPRFPPGIEKAQIPHRIVLRYRNPLVGQQVFLP